MRIIITGISGFVGKYLLERITGKSNEENNLFAYSVEKKSENFLKERQKDVKNIEILGLDLRVDSNTIKDLKKVFPLVEFSRINIKDTNKVERMIKKFKPEQIYHLAAQSSVSYSWLNPVETIETNIIGGINIFEAVRKYCPLCKILVACTAEEYAADLEEKDVAINENFKIYPSNPYAISKAALDFFATTYYRMNNILVYISRSFNHIGPGQSDRFVASDFAKQIVEIEKGLRPPVVFVGNINVYRDFLDVRDVVEAYCAIIDKGKAGQAYNVCSGIKMKISEILDILLSYSRVKNIEIKVDKNKVRPVDIISIYGDNSKLKRHTGWEPKYKVKDSLKDILNWWRERS